MRGPVIGPAIGIFHLVGQLMLDDVRTKAEQLIEDSSRCCPEAVTGDGLLVKAHAPEGGIDGVLAHGAQI